MNPIDAAFIKFERLLQDFENRESEIESEADLRFQFLDRILLEVLGWTRADIIVEIRSDSGYADYLLRLGDRNAAVVEAKRSSVDLVSTARREMSTYLIRGPVLKPGLDGIKQAKEYASDHGCGFAAVTTGLSWVCFQPNRQDGKPFLDGQAIVFPTLASVRDSFSVFYELFSKEAIAEKRYSIHLSRAEGTLISPHIEWYKAIDGVRNPLLSRTPLARDVDRIFDRFFKSLVDENDHEMLVDCFVETKESREADATLQKLAEEVLADISSLSTGTGEELQQEIAEAIESRLGEIVLIIGQKGAGKTTFIDRFFSVVLRKILRDQCVVLRANLAEATQDERGVEGWLTEKLISQAEHRLFRDGIPTYDQLQGMYFAEYQRWQVGEFRYLYAVPRDRFVSPLLCLSALRLLLDKLGGARDEQAEQYIEISDIVTYFEPAGARVVDIIDICSSMLKTRLIEPYDPADDSAEGRQRVRISHAGRMHHEMALNDGQYLRQMAMVTSVRRPSLADKIRPLALTFPADPGPWLDAGKAFASYLIDEDAALMTLPNDPAYEGQRSLRRDFATRWVRTEAARVSM